MLDSEFQIKKMAAIYFDVVSILKQNKHLHMIDSVENNIFYVVMLVNHLCLIKPI